MSQPRSRSRSNVSIDAAPWLTDNGLWSPTSPSTSSAALTSARPTLEGTAPEISVLPMPRMTPHITSTDGNSNHENLFADASNTPNGKTAQQGKLDEADVLLLEATTTKRMAAEQESGSAKSAEACALRACRVLETVPSVNESADENKQENMKSQWITEKEERIDSSVHASPEASPQQQQQQGTSELPSAAPQMRIVAPSVVALHSRDVAARHPEAQSDIHLDDAIRTQTKGPPSDESADGIPAELDIRAPQQHEEHPQDHLLQPPSLSRDSSIVKPSTPRLRGAAVTTTSASVAESATTATDRLAWVSCDHSDAPARYRDTPAYYCNYCSYTVCEACYALIPASLQSAPQKQQRHPSEARPCLHEKHDTARGVNDRRHAAEQEVDVTNATTAKKDAHRASVRTDWLNSVLTSPSMAVRGGGVGARDSRGFTATTTTAVAQDVSNAGLARSSRAHRRLFHSTPDLSAHVMSPVKKNDRIISNSKSPPPSLLCHLCSLGHLLREEALLHEWCCEGPAPENRLHRGRALVYDTQNIQKYHFMRAQRDARLSSTAPLHAQVLSVSPAILPCDAQTPLAERSEVLDGKIQAEQQRIRHASSTALDQTRVHVGPSRKDPMPSILTTAAKASTAGLSHRRNAVPADGPSTPRSVRVGDHDYAVRCHSYLRPHKQNSAATAGVSRCACEEGGSFVFSVRNPRLEVSLVWCGVNGQPREETPAYGAATMQHNSKNVNGDTNTQFSHASSSITPLLLWRCPPSLPGLPARPYRVVVPYGCYAFANIHALALYTAADIFRKSSSQLIHPPGPNGATAEGGRGSGGAYCLEGFDDPVSRLASMKVAPASKLRPLLTVAVLHHVATTPRPLASTSKLLCSALPHSHAITDNDGALFSTKNSTAPTMLNTVDGEALKRRRAPDTAAATLPQEGEAKRLKSEAHQSVLTPRPNAERTMDDDDAITPAAASELKWPDGLASPELALCVDHLLHGRSVAVYGIASKFFFLQHVANSAELKHFQVVTVDASSRRGGHGVSAQRHASVNHNVNDAEGLSGEGGTRRSIPPNNKRGSVDSSSSFSRSVLRQLVLIGQTLLRNVSPSTVLTAEMRAAMTAAAAAASHTSEFGNKHRGKPTKRAAHHTALPINEHSEEGDGEKDRSVDAHCGGGGDGTATSAGRLARAFLPGDKVRSPAMARDVTSAVLHAVAAATSPEQQNKSRRNAAVDVVDLDAPTPTTTATAASSSCSPSSSSACEDAQPLQHDVMTAIALGGEVTPARGTVHEVLPSIACTPPRTVLHGGLSPFRPLSPSAHQLYGSGRTTLAQLGPSSQASASTSPSLSLLSPIPAFFEALQRTVDGGRQRQGESKEANAINSFDNKALTADRNDGIRGEFVRPVTCEELPELFGEVNALRLPLRPSLMKEGRSQNRITTPSSSPTAVVAEMRWKPPVVLYANDAVRQHVLQHLRHKHRRRRCVQWVSLPSTSAAAQLDAQTRGPEKKAEDNISPAALSHSLLTNAHQTRPGWQPPLLLVVHNIDLLYETELNIFLQLCARFAFPQPHLQLLMSFDDPLWPLGPVAAALERHGVCAVQLRSLLLPRVHEMELVSGIHVLTEFEAAVGVGGGGGGRRHGSKKGGGLRNSLSSGVSSTTAGASASTVGNAHLLQDTLRRVLFSLPPAFNGLLRILLDLQDEFGEGVFISLFTVAERFERSGVMVSQGRLKALIRELTSNRIARYDSAEHALMVPQVSRLRKVLDEITAQREGGGENRSR